jgi:hypothetical protein
MKKERIIANIIVIVIAAIAVFFIGWIQLQVKSNSCTVMVTKTGGVYEKPILPGKFTWRWERLLPTNVQLRSFKLAPYTSKQTVSGELPSADIYSKQIKDNPDFSYNVILQISISLSPEQLVELVKKNNFTTQEDVDAYLDGKSKIAAKKVMEYFIDKKVNDISFVTNILSDSEIKDVVVKNKSDFDGMTISNVEVISAKIPDMQLYSAAKDAFSQYQSQMKESLKAAAEKDADTVIEEDRSIQRLEKVGKLLQKYPQLQDVFKNGDVTAIMKALGALTGK